MENLNIYEDIENNEDDFEDILPSQEYKGFSVTDMKSADWAIRKIKKNTDNAEERISFAKEEISKLQEFIKKEEKSRDSSNHYLESLLGEYLFNKRVEDKNFKIKTPAGTVSTKKSTKWIYDDEKVISFLKDNNYLELIRVKEEISKNDIKKAFKVLDSGIVVTSDGEIVDGIEIEKSESLVVNF